MMPLVITPRVAIIYLTYHGKDSYRDITRCFSSLASIDYPRDCVEIICVENPSPHGASWPFIEKEWRPRAGVDFPALTIIKNEKDLGYSGANNVGLAVAIEHNCDYVFLLNQDADIDLGFLKETIAVAVSDPSIGFVQSLLLLGQDRNKINSIGNRYHYLGYGYSGCYQWPIADGLAEIDHERGTQPYFSPMYFSGAAVLVRVAMARQLGLFDTAFYMYHEDVDASFNALFHGWKTVVAPKSIVYHYYEFSKSIKKFYWMERNRYVVLLTYYRLSTLALLALPFFGVEIISLAFALRGGWWREKIRAWGFFFLPSTWRWIIVRRSKIQRERQISDREFLRHAESKILFQENDISGAGSGVVTRIANPLMTAVWRCIYWCIRF